MTSAADAVAQLIVESFGALPRSGKPSVRSNGFPEWTVLAGIAVHKEKGTSINKIGPDPAHSPFFENVKKLISLDASLHCICLATGAKCLPSSKVAVADGLALHDSHAEILAIRGFNRFAPGDFDYTLTNQISPR
jgi:tRNA-specific adenosine deaminase 1